MSVVYWLTVFLLIGVVLGTVVLALTAVMTQAIFSLMDKVFAKLPPFAVNFRVERLLIVLIIMMFAIVCLSTGMVVADYTYVTFNYPQIPDWAKL